MARTANFQPGAQQPGLTQAAASGPQSQSGGPCGCNKPVMVVANNKTAVADNNRTAWPGRAGQPVRCPRRRCGRRTGGDDGRWPNSTGAQNGVRYAYFAQARRLAIEVRRPVTDITIRWIIRSAGSRNSRVTADR